MQFVFPPTPKKTFTVDKFVNGQWYFGCGRHVNVNIGGNPEYQVAIPSGNPGKFQDLYFNAPAGQKQEVIDLINTCKEYVETTNPYNDIGYVGGVKKSRRTRRSKKRRANRRKKTSRR